MSALLALPKETRMTIFEYCLTFKNEIVPYAAYWELDEGILPFSKTKGKHDLALFYVNGEISVEAPFVFYKHNTFRLSYVDSGKDLHLSDRIREDFWRARIDLFRHINVPFDVRDVHPRRLLDTSKRYEVTTEIWDSEDEELLSTIHGEHLEYSDGVWSWKINLFGDMKLKTLRMDFENLYCTTGCCRLFDDLVSPKHVLKNLVYWHRHCEAERCHWRMLSGSEHHGVEFSNRVFGLADMEIIVVGLLTEREKDMAHSVGFACELCPLKGKRLDTSACLRGKIDPDLVKVVQ